MSGKAGFLMLLVLLVGVVVSQDDFDYGGDFGGDYGDYGGEYGDYGGDFGEYGDYDDYGGYGEYDDYDQGVEEEEEELLPGVLAADEFSFPKLLKGPLSVVVEFLGESWGVPSETFKDLAYQFQEREDVLVVKVVTANTDLVEKYSLADESNQIYLFTNGQAIPVESDSEDSITFIETMIDEHIFTISSKIQGFASKTAEEKSQALQEVESYISNAQNPSPLSTKLAKFVKKITSSSDSNKLQSEETRLENLLDNSANISGEKVLEFRVRLQLLRAMQE